MSKQFDLQQAFERAERAYSELARVDSDALSAFDAAEQAYLDKVKEIDAAFAAPTSVDNIGKLEGLIADRKRLYAAFSRVHAEGVTRRRAAAAETNAAMDALRSLMG